MAKQQNPYLLYYAQDEEEEDDFGGFWSDAADLLNPVTAYQSYAKKGVSGVIAEARTELADTTAPKSSIVHTVRAALGPAATSVLSLTAQNADYVRAIDRGWKGKYQPNGTLYYWDKTKDQMEFIHPAKGHKVIVRKGTKTHTYLMNSDKLNWSPTSQTYLPSAKMEKGEKVQVEEAGKSTGAKPISGASTELTLFDERMTDMDAGEGGFKEKAMAHLKDKWPWYAGGAAAVVGIPLLLMAVGSFNEDWVILLDGQPSGTVSEFYEINKVGNKHGVVPISDTDMAMILALQPGENHNVPSNTGFTVISRG
jgi:hypothetical protein